MVKFGRAVILWNSTTPSPEIGFKDAFQKCAARKVPDNTIQLLILERCQKCLWSEEEGFRGVFGLQPPLGFCNVHYKIPDWPRKASPGVLVKELVPPPINAFKAM